MNNSSEPSETFQRGSGRPFATVDGKKLIFWAACSLSDLFNADRLLTYAGHSH